MDPIQKFIDSFVTIDYVKEIKEYRHYPFKLLATKDGKAELNALAGLNSVQCYKRYSYYALKGCDEILMSMDFPPVADMETDFIYVLAYANKTVECRAVAYDKTTGKILQIYDGTEKVALMLITAQFNQVYQAEKAKVLISQN